MKPILKISLLSDLIHFLEVGIGLSHSRQKIQLNQRMYFELEERVRETETLVVTLKGHLIKIS